MILSWDKAAFSHLSEQELQEAIKERRQAIRKHRDQLGDDRCWLDDFFVWEFLKDSKPLSTMPSFDEGMKICTSFYECRGAQEADTVPKDAELDAHLWDDDLISRSQSQLVDELEKIQKALKDHRDITSRPRTIVDDRTLYAILPEKIPADFRLPPRDEFLGEAKAPKAGCPSFWRSHGSCTAVKHNFSQWGPCR